MKSVRVLIVSCVLAMSAAAGCGGLPHVLYGKRLAGQVIDGDTGQPLPGAHVAYVWESTIIPSGFTGHNSRTICYHAAAATTDAQGRFQIEPWREWSTYNVEVLDPIALVYAREYTPRQIVLQEEPGKGPVERPQERYALKRFTGTVDERMDVLWGGIANRGCAYGGQSQKSLFNMLKAIYGEVKQIASSSAQVDKLHFFAMEAAYAGLALDPNGPAEKAQLDEFVREKVK